VGDNFLVKSKRYWARSLLTFILAFAEVAIAPYPPRCMNEKKTEEQPHNHPSLLTLLEGTWAGEGCGQ